jgi:hypothetical protein
MGVRLSLSSSDNCPSRTTFSDKLVAVFNASQIEMNRKARTALEYRH